MLLIKDYIIPKTTEEVINLLEDKDSLIISGGVELINIKPKNKKLIDITYLPLSYIKEDNEYITIGATTTYTNIVNSEILQNSYGGIISQAAQSTASLQVRNQATIGGNIGASNPSSDLLAALIAVDSYIKLKKLNKVIPLTEFFNIKDKDFIEEVLIPNKKDIKGIYLRVSRTEFDFPIVNIAVTMKTIQDNIEHIKIGIGGVSTKPFNPVKTENTLKGKKLSDDLIEQAINVLLEEIDPKTTVRGSKEYKKYLTGILFKRSLLDLIKN